LIPSTCDGLVGSAIVESIFVEDADTVSVVVESFVDGKTVFAGLVVIAGKIVLVGGGASVTV
jgi:hypothetical protein